MWIFLNEALTAKEKRPLAVGVGIERHIFLDFLSQMGRWTGLLSFSCPLN